MRIENGWIALLVSASMVAVLVALLLWNPDENRARSGSQGRLVLYCAAGMKRPVSEAVEQYRREYGVQVDIQYGGSGTLYSNIKVARRGDLYLAADDSYILQGRDEGLIAESIPLATITPVIAVAKGNPKQIHKVEDLLRDDVSFALANPDAAAIGRITHQVLVRAGQWNRLKDAAKVFKPTVGDVATDIVIGAVDAGIIWDATAGQYPELEVVSAELLAGENRTIQIGILNATEKPTQALRFARYLGAPEKGLQAFRRHKFSVVEGDDWAEVPEIVLFSGGVNRLAIRHTLRVFEKREGVRITSVYNGCGILVSQMKAGERPDAYFACDRSFMNEVTDLFMDSVDVSRTDMVMLVARGNPKGINRAADLQQPGLAVGVANADQSALGSLTRRVLSDAGIYEAVMKNVKVQTPTADLLVNQIRTGSLDAVIVYEANTMHVHNQLEILKLGLPNAEAFQPIAVRRGSRFAHLSIRLMDAILSESSRKAFESNGFDWEAGKE